MAWPRIGSGKPGFGRSGKIRSNGLAQAKGDLPGLVWLGPITVLSQANLYIRLAAWLGKNNLNLLTLLRPTKLDWCGLGRVPSLFQLAIKHWIVFEHIFVPDLCT